MLTRVARNAPLGALALVLLALPPTAHAKLIFQPSWNAESTLHKFGQAYIIQLKPTGVGDEPVTPTQQAKYCAAAQEWARRHHEVTEGQHEITRVTFFKVPGGDVPSNSHVEWMREHGRPHVWVMGNGQPVKLITMYDVAYGCRTVWDVVDGEITDVGTTCEHADPDATCESDENGNSICTLDGEPIVRSALDWGWVLAHENSHWFHAIDDEYKPDGNAIEGFKVCVGDEDNEGTEQTSMMSEWNRNHWCDDETHVNPLTFMGVDVSNPMSDSGWERARTHWPILESHVDGTYEEVDLDALDPIECVWLFELSNDSAILLDASGSMSHVDPDTQQTAFHQALQGALGLYNSTAVGRSTGILQFNSDAQWLIDYEPFETPALGPFNENPAGATDICEAIITGANTTWAENPGEGQGAMLLLTDGRPTVGTCDSDADVLDAAWFACSKGPYPIAIFPLAYGDADAVLLAEVAQTCGGMVLAAGQDSNFPLTEPHDMKVDLARAGIRVRHHLELLHARRRFDALEQSETFHVPEGSPQLDVSWLGNGKKGITVGGIELSCDLATLTFELESPSGVLVDAELHSIVGPGEIGYDTRTVRVPDPEPGTWTARILAPDATCPTVAPRFGWVGSVKHGRLSAQVEAIPDSAPRNTPVTLVAWMRNPEPYPTTGLTVDARVVSRGSSTDVEMRDDGLGVDPVAGDGQYTGVFNAATAALPSGPYTVRASIATTRTSTGVTVGEGGLPEVTASRPPPLPVAAELLVESTFAYSDCCDPALSARDPSAPPCQSACRPARLTPRFRRVRVGSTRVLTATLASEEPMRTEDLEIGMGPGIVVSDVRGRSIGRRGVQLIQFRATVRDDAPVGPHSLTVRAGSRLVRKENAFVVGDRRPGRRTRP
jgi:hypothetical protein